MVKNALGFLGLIRTVGHQQTVFFLIPLSTHPYIREETGLPSPYFLGDEVMRLHFVMSNDLRGLQRLTGWKTGKALRNFLRTCTGRGIKKESEMQNTGCELLLLNPMEPLRYPAAH